MSADSTKNILLVKTSSLGDLLHTMPALTDAQKHFPKITFHWLVEENFAEIPAMHPSVSKVIPISWRRLRKKFFINMFSAEFKEQLNNIRQHRYETILDNQGLLKSAIPAWLANGPVSGLDFHSVRESLAAVFYQSRLSIDPNLHAITRNRLFFANALGYPPPPDPLDYGLTTFVGNATKKPSWLADDYFVFIHSTTWPSKHWPEEYWVKLCNLAAGNRQIILPWATLQEHDRAQRIASTAPTHCHVPPKLNLKELAALLTDATAAVAVDTGPAHLAAAVNTPAICLYGPTDPNKIGTKSPLHHHLTGTCDQAPCKKQNCPLPPQPINPPCFQSTTPEKVWQILQQITGQHIAQIGRNRL